MKNSNVILPTSILLGCLILGSFIYVSQLSKQNSVEKQQQIELQVKSEQDKRDYIAKRKTECLAIYKTESSKFNNVESWSYQENEMETDNPFTKVLNGKTKDSCEIIYKSEEGKTFSKYF